MFVGIAQGDKCAYQFNQLRLGRRKVINLSYRFQLTPALSCMPLTPFFLVDIHKCKQYNSISKSSHLTASTRMLTLLYATWN